MEGKVFKKAFFSLMAVLSISMLATAAYREIESRSQPNVIQNSIGVTLSGGIFSEGIISWDRNHTVSTWMTRRGNPGLQFGSTGSSTGIGRVHATSPVRHEVGLNPAFIVPHTSTISAP